MRSIGDISQKCDLQMLHCRNFIVFYNQNFTLFIIKFQIIFNYYFLKHHIFSSRYYRSIVNTRSSEYARYQNLKFSENFSCFFLEKSSIYILKQAGELAIPCASHYENNIFLYWIWNIICLSEFEEISIPRIGKSEKWPSDPYNL